MVVHREFEVKAGVMLGARGVKTKAASPPGDSRKNCVLYHCSVDSGEVLDLQSPVHFQGHQPLKCIKQGQVVNISRFVDLSCCYLMTTVIAVKDGCGSFPIQFYLQN